MFQPNIRRDFLFRSHSRASIFIRMPDPDDYEEDDEVQEKPNP